MPFSYCPRKNLQPVLSHDQSKTKPCQKEIQNHVQAIQATGTEFRSSSNYQLVVYQSSSSSVADCLNFVPLADIERSSVRIYICSNAMSYGKLVIRHGFLDFEHVPFAGSNITHKRRAQSAPATLTKVHDGGQREQHVVHVETTSDPIDNLLEEVRACHARLDLRIASTRQLHEKCNALLNFVTACNTERFTRGARTFLECLATTYHIHLDELVMKMLFNVLHMHHDRVTRFFSDLRSRKAFQDFHVKFILDAHGQHGATHCLVFHRKNKQIRCYTVKQRGLVVVGVARATSICQGGDALCLQKLRCGAYAVVSATDTLHAARIRWTQLRAERQEIFGIDTEYGTI